MMARRYRAEKPSSRGRSKVPLRWVARIGCIAAITVVIADFPVASARPKTATKWLDYGEAQRFVLGLVNRDRKKAGLEPVALDEAASKAGLRHARDMAAKGFTGHLGSDGSTPEQRYTEGGGTDFVQENAACLSDTIERELDAKPRFDQAKLAALHQMFMDEVPPNDGHRRNILNPLHNRVGIGLAQPASVPQPCLTQEFVDDYGEYEPLPREVKPTVRVAGTIAAPLQFGGIGIGRTPLPKALPRESLNGKLYRIPAPDTLYFPKGFKTPKPVLVTGRQFSLDLDLGKKPAPGSYAVTVWAKKPGSSKLFLISMRTLTAR
jgi:uncharacterized protein YkwD